MKVTRLKERECMYEHWSPRWMSFITVDEGGRHGRTLEDPIGDEVKDSTKNNERDDELAEAMNVCRLARAKHECGDFFSVGAPSGVALFELECYKSFASLPGVFFVEFEASRPGATTSTRYRVLTNAQWLMKLSRFDAGRPRRAVAGWGADANELRFNLLSAAVCSCWASTFSDYVTKPDCCCPFCADGHRDGGHCSGPAEKDFCEEFKRCSDQPAPRGRL